MLELQRFTTEYIDTEDRIRIAGQGADGQAVVLWLTQRLLVRLLPALVRWLEQLPDETAAGQGGSAAALHADVVHAMAQQCAAAGTEPAPPVPAESAQRSGVVVHVEVAPCEGGDAVQLVLRCAGAPALDAGLVLTSLRLRQWLHILHQQCRAGGWALHVWPHWMELAQEPPAWTREHPPVWH